MSSDTLPRRLEFCLQWLQKNGGYQFKDPDLFALAFVQKSSKDAQNPSANNERLEFLGDAALSLLVGEALYREYPEADEGFMTIERSKIVCGQNLSAWGYEAGFDRLISAGDGVKVTDAMVEDSVEAVAGAFFLDGGLDAVRSFLQCFRDYPDQGNGFDSRRHLERDCDYEKRGVPRYETTLRREKHSISYTSTVTLDGQVVGTGMGAELEDAERAAARSAMLLLGRLTAEEERKRTVAVRTRYRKLLALRTRKSTPLPVRLGGDPQSRKRLKAASQAKALVKATETKPTLPVALGKIAEGRNDNASRQAKQHQTEAQAAQHDRKEAAQTTAAAKAAQPARTAVQERTQPATARKGQRSDGRLTLKALVAQCCKKLKIAPEQYRSIPGLDGYPPKAFTVYKLNGNMISMAKGSKMFLLHADDADKILKLLAAPVDGTSRKLNAEVHAEAGRIEAAFSALLKEKKGASLRWDNLPDQPKNGEVRMRIHADNRSLAETSGVDRDQAKLMTLLQAVDNTKLWKDLMARLGIPESGSFKGNEPAQLLEELCHAKGICPRLVTLDQPDSSMSRVGLFLDGRLCADITTTNRNGAFLWLPLQLLCHADRIRKAHSLTKSTPSAKETSSPRAKAAPQKKETSTKPAESKAPASSKPAPAKKVGDKSETPSAKSSSAKKQEPAKPSSNGKKAPAAQTETPQKAARVVSEKPSAPRRAAPAEKTHVTVTAKPESKRGFKRRLTDFFRRKK